MKQFLLKPMLVMTDGQQLKNPSEEMGFLLL
jgi:hypothetical protein